MASKVLYDSFDGSGELNGSPVTNVTGVGALNWSALQNSTPTAGMFSRGAADGSLVFPGSYTGEVRRLNMAPASMTRGTGTTVLELRAYGGVDFWIDIDDSTQIRLGYTTSGSSPRWLYDGAAFETGTISASVSYVTASVWRIEVTTTDTKFYLNNTLVGTASAGLSTSNLIASVNLDYSVLSALSAPIGTTKVVLEHLHIKTETTSGALGALAISAFISMAGPLAQPLVLSRLGSGVIAHAMAGSPLGPVATIAKHYVVARASDPGPLRALSAVARAVPLSRVAAASPLGGARVAVFHDFTAQIEAAGALGYYACNLVDGALVVRVPISSWQGTLQTAGAAYLQAVIPAVASTGAVIAALSSGAVFVIYRGARLPDGTVIEQEMARSLIESTQFDQGPNRYTCTISGYSDAIAPPTSAYPATDRTLRGVRSISSGAGGVRVRCAVDWFLRPGQIAIAGGAPFVAGYLNYYALTGDSYMDVGERTV